MCGIAGIVGLDGGPVREDEVRRMCAAMVHRGPNGEGTYLGRGVGLGMRRLSVIDLFTGDQPIRNEDGSVWVVFNGEIYNYRELRLRLEAAGHRFSTASDTETIAHLYEDYAEGCVDHLRGMFAFAVWDENRKRLLLARDRLGIKPLYYAEVRGRLVFSSELKALLQLSEIERRIDWRSFDHLLTFFTTPKDSSIISGIRKLEPGHVLLASPFEPVQVRKYWDAVWQAEPGRSEADWVDEIRALLEESVRLHLVSDVPLGAFLSGGIDSSSVVAMMARHTRQRVKTFSIGFADAAFSELPHARRVAKALGTDHRELILEPDALSILDDLTWHLDEPFGDSSAIPTYMVSKLAREHVTVVLSGDGGDELFAGYDRYLVEARERIWNLLPSAGRRVLREVAERLPERVRGRNFLRHVTLPGPQRYLDASTLLRRDEKERLVHPDVAAHLREHDSSRFGLDCLLQDGLDWLSALQRLDLKTYLPLDILTKVDRMSMAHSLEARVPLLDHRLVELACRIPPELKLNGGTTKHVFKKAMRGILPDETIDRPKQGFAIPLGRWFRGRLGPFVRDLLLSERSRARGILDPAAVERRIARADGGLGLDLWTLISFELWCRTFFDAPVPVECGESAGHVLVDRRAS
jgi:asparagine synthase (glutamine-hydrolysing)